MLGKKFCTLYFFFHRSIHILIALSNTLTYTHNIRIHTNRNRKLIPSSSVLSFVNTAWMHEALLLNVFFCPKHVYISNNNCIYKLWHAHWPSGEKLCSDQLIESCDWRYLVCIMNKCWNEKALSHIFNSYSKYFIKYICNRLIIKYELQNCQSLILIFDSCNLLR